MDQESAFRTGDLGSILSQKTTKNLKFPSSIHRFHALCSVIKRDSVKPLSSVVDKWAGGSLTRRPKGPFAVSWPRQLDEESLFQFNKNRNLKTK